MNQKNVFTVISAALALYSLAYYFMSDTFTAGMPIEAAGKKVASNLLQVCGVLGFGIALMYYATCNTPSISWAFCLGAGLLVLNSLKHKFIDHENVPIPAILFQAAICLAVGYVWMQDRRSSGS
jgi:hypothetical protein